jgi:hypothetical protein
MNSSCVRSRPVRLALLAGVLSALALTSGCILAAVGAGAAAVGYVEGSLTAPLTTGLDPAARAGNAAIQQLGFAKVSEKKEATSDVIVARTGTDKRIEVKVEFVTNEVTKVTIRVGTFGDEALSMAILDKIKANL